MDGVSQFGLFVRSVSIIKTRLPRQVTGADRRFKVDLCALEYVSELQARIAESDLLLCPTSGGMEGQSSPVPENILIPDTLLVRYHIPTL